MSCTEHYQITFVLINDRLTMKTLTGFSESTTPGLTFWLRSSLVQTSPALGSHFELFPVVCQQWSGKLLGNLGTR